jgi:hypothetical protein
MNIEERLTGWSGFNIFRFLVEKDIAYQFQTGDLNMRC